MNKNTDNKRIFTYGCSVTQHHWPTWADIILHSAIINCYSVFNTGLSGLGNTGIKRSLIQTHEKYDITEEDTLLVMWTSFLREDRYTHFPTQDNPRDSKPNEHITQTNVGNVLNAPFYNRDFIRDYFCLEHYIINSISEISTCRRAFNLSFEGHITIEEGISDAHEQNAVDSSLTDSVYATFCNGLNMPNPYSVTTASFRDSQYAQYYEVDGHPVPQHALEYVLSVVEPHLPFDILPETIEWVEQWNRRLLDQLKLYGPKLGRRRDIWAQQFHNLMQKWYADNEVTIARDIWGGDATWNDRVDTQQIMNQFIKSNKKLG